MLEATAADVLSTIATNPAAAGAATFIGIEAAKKIFPKKVSGNEATLSFLAPAIGAGILKAAGYAAFAGIGWLPLIVNMLIGSVLAKPMHDAAAEAKSEIDSKKAPEVKKEGP